MWLIVMQDKYRKCSTCGTAKRFRLDQQAIFDCLDCDLHSLHRRRATFDIGSKENVCDTLHLLSRQLTDQRTTHPSSHFGRLLGFGMHFSRIRA